MPGRPSKSPLDGIRPADFFVLRAPLLPFSAILEWGDGLLAPNAGDDDLDEALVADRARLIERLRVLAARPDVREAIFCASPTLNEALDAWLADPSSPRAAGVTNIVVRYLSRMAGRATPFGLFSRCGLGRIEPGPTRLTVADRAELARHTRLDMHYLSLLVQILGRDEDVRRALRFFPNTSLVRLGDSLHYVEASYDAEKRTRAFELVSVGFTAALEGALATARAGAGSREIAVAVLETDPALEDAAASGFVTDLIDAQIVTSELEPPITGPEPIHHVIRVLGDRGVCADVRATLESVRDRLAEMDERGVGQAIEGYQRVAKALESLPAKVDPSFLFQVDLAQRDVGARLGGGFVRELERGIALLQRLSFPNASSDVEAFCKAFRTRYEEAEIPLCVALDEEIGVGFGATSSVPSPLLNGLAFPAEAAAPRAADARRAHLLRRLIEHSKAGARTWSLTEQDIVALATSRPGQMPDSFFANVSVAATSKDAFEAGSFQLSIHGLANAGARMLGRFCHGDPALTEAVVAHLRAEESLVPDAIFAEIVHLPQGRTGNILCRPVLRPYEIPFLASPGVDPEHVIELDDLLVSASDGRIRLRSKRLGKKVLPRITNAHNPRSTSLSVYRFLCAVADQDMQHAFGWSWGDFGDAPYLPRVIHGNLVLSLERWAIDRSDVDAMKRAKGVARLRAVRALRGRRGLPRWIAAGGPGDNFVPVDLDNVLAVESWVDMLKPGEPAGVTELFPAPDELTARGSDGAYVCEIVVPFLSTRAPEQADPPAPLPMVPRTFPPASEWLFLKIYGGPLTVDAFLRDCAAPIVRSALERGAKQWFFLRYGDPGNHLRLRLRGDPDFLLSTILPRFRDACAPWLAGNRVFGMVIDTYHREIERYGGDHGIELAESIFFEDSEAVVDVLATLTPEAEADARWRLTLLGLHLLLTDLGFDADGRVRVMGHVRDMFALEHRVDTAFERELGMRFRGVRPELEQMLERPAAEQPPELRRGAAALARRTARLEPIAGELRSRVVRGATSLPLEALAASFLHMHANRMLLADQRAHELILYDYLYRVYESRVARERRSR